MINSIVTISFNSAKEAENALKSIRIDQENTKRSELVLKTSKNKLKADIKAKDLIAFRAGMNMIGRLLTVHTKMKEVE